MNEAKILSGFRDIYGESYALKSFLLEKLKNVFISYGFSGLATPHLEYLQTLAGNGSEDIKKEIYKFLDHGNREVALRFDQTVPLARFIAMHRGTISFPYKRFAIGEVFRGERAQKGRYREFTQCDFDIVGSHSIYADAEILQIIASSMDALGIEANILINHRKLLNALLEICDIKDSTTALRLIDKLDKISVEKLLEEAAQTSLNIDNFTKFLNLINFKITGTKIGEFSEFLKSSGIEIKDSLALALEELDLLFSIISSVEFGSTFVLDLSIARGLNYYTGIVYECKIKGAESLGSICSGGRYDDLINKFSNESITAVGASVGLDRLLSILSQNQSIKAKSISYLLIPLNKDANLKLVPLSHALRARGIANEIYFDNYKLKKALSYANNNAIDKVLILGEDELKEGKILLKDMLSGDQKLINIDELTKGE